MTNKQIYDFVFVVLVYRNTQDLQDFFQHNHISNSHTVVVNSYYDETSELVFKNLASMNGATFLSVPNRGYGAGNNRGCEYAMEHFDFSYLIISNADVMIEKLDISDIYKYGDAIFAPRILNLRGRNQNPAAPFTPTIIYEKVAHYCYLKGHRHLIYLVYAYSRMKKNLFYLLFHLGYRKVFSAHGAFLILSKSIIQRLHPLYNNEMFLFGEESHVGRLARLHNVDTYYLPEIVIRHKEDGSMKIASINVFNMAAHSNKVYYDYWFNSKRNKK